MLLPLRRPDEITGKRRHRLIGIACHCKNVGSVIVSTPRTATLSRSWSITSAGASSTATPSATVTPASANIRKSWAIIDCCAVSAVLVLSEAAFLTGENASAGSTSTTIEWLAMGNRSKIKRSNLMAFGWSGWNSLPPRRYSLSKNCPHVVRARRLSGSSTDQAKILWETLT